MRAQEGGCQPTTISASTRRTKAGTQDGSGDGGAGCESFGSSLVSLSARLGEDDLGEQGSDDAAVVPPSQMQETGRGLVRP